MNLFENSQTKTKGKLRVLYFTPVFTFGQSITSSYLINEVNTVVRNYKNIEFLVYFVKDRIQKEIIKENDRILQVNRISYKTLLFIKDMLKIFIKYKPDVVHSHYIVPSIFVNFFAKIFRVPTILHGRGKDMNYFPYFSVKSKILLLIAGRLNNMILTVGKSMKDNCLRFKMTENKVKVIYNGIDFNKFNVKEKKKFSNQRPLNLLNLGVFSLEKGQHLIIEACKKLKDNNIDFHLTLIGDGNPRYIQMLVALINKHELNDNVDFVKPVDHKSLPNYMKNADVFVFPSITEGLPNVVLEAMSMKLVLILTRVGGNIELAQDIGSILVDINNPQQLFEAILYYYNHPKEIEIGGEINRNFIVSTFSWDKHAKELYHVYNYLAKKGKYTNEK